MVSLRRLGELGESGRVLSPVEFAAVNDDTADGCSVTTDPLCGTVDDDVGPMRDGTAEEASRTESVINLQDCQLQGQDFG